MYCFVCGYEIVAGSAPSGLGTQQLYPKCNGCGRSWLVKSTYNEVERKETLIPFNSEREVR